MQMTLYCIIVRKPMWSSLSSYFIDPINGCGYRAT
jgi:hypothetical protein